MLDIKDLNAFYGKSHILRGVNLNIEKGEIVSLLGRNGVGRSTLVKAIMGLVQPQGSIKFLGEEISGMPSHNIALKGIGYVPENRDIFPTLTVKENLLLGVKDTKAKGQWDLNELFKMFPNLKERQDVMGGSISGGEQQMLAIGRALMSDPSYLLLDEPSLGLAPKLVDQIADLIKEINEQGVTVLLVEQNANMALNVSDHGYIMETGNVVMDLSLIHISEPTRPY